VRIAAQDVGRLSRALAGCAGFTVAASGALTLLRWPGYGWLDAALVPAGLALVLLVLPVAHPAARIGGYALAGAAAGLGAAMLGRYPAAAAAAVLSGVALACIDIQIRPRSGGAVHYRVADPLVAGAALIALVALVPRMFTPVLTSYDRLPPYLAGALLVLTVGVILARPEAGPLRTADAAGPGTTIRRLTPALVAVPIIAALVSAFVVRTGISRPAPAISTGAVLAALGVIALVGYLIRSLEGADRQQRELVDKLRERQEFAATLLQSMDEAVMVLDANYRVLDVNRRWRELTGHGDEQAMSAEPPVPPAGGDWMMPRADGTRVPVLATIAPIPDAAGVPRAYVATYVDITERKRAEEALGEHAAELEEGNGQLREANARLEATLVFKNDLTSMLTHDVNQPISSIAIFSQLLASDWADLPDHVRLDMVMKIDKNTRRLIKMMSDLQLLFRLDTGSVTARRTPVPLLEVVERATAESADEVEIQIGEDVSVLADREHLHAVVQNLVKNAFAYGAAPVQIRAEWCDDGVELTVEDHGAGIPEDLVPDLFGRFMRGAGLGLFIVRHLVEANGGAVRYEPVEPRGARLVVTLETASVPV
jgi:signal transduction histidine kinase